MVGDVNLFFNDPDDPHTAEIEIMIASNLDFIYLSFGSPTNLLIYPSLDSQCRRKGLGSEALQTMMFYGTLDLLHN